MCAFRHESLLSLLSPICTTVASSASVRNWAFHSTRSWLFIGISHLHICSLTNRKLGLADYRHQHLSQLLSLAPAQPRRLCTRWFVGQRYCDTSTFLNISYLHPNPPLHCMKSVILPLSAFLPTKLPGLSVHAGQADAAAADGRSAAQRRRGCCRRYKLFPAGFICTPICKVNLK